MERILKYGGRQRNSNGKDFRMGIFSRINDIVGSNIIHMLDKAENPEKMVRLMIQEMEDTLVEVKSSAAKLIAEQKTYERQRSDLNREIKTWEERAQLALEKNREDLARGALNEKLLLNDQLGAVEARLGESEASLGQLREDIKTLNDKLEDAKERQKSLILRKKSLDNQKKIQNSLDSAGSAKAFARFEAYANDMDRLEGEVEASRLRKGTGSSLGGGVPRLRKPGGHRKRIGCIEVQRQAEN